MVGRARRPDPPAFDAAVGRAVPVAGLEAVDAADVDWRDDAERGREYILFLLKLSSILS